MSIEARDRLKIEKCLRQAGLEVDSLWDLKSRPRDLSRVAPALLDLLKDLEAPRIKTDLLRLISRTSVSPRQLVEELKKLRPEIEHDYRPRRSLGNVSNDKFLEELDRIKKFSSGAASLGWALADVIETQADASIYDDLVEIVYDRRYGRARQMLPLALARISSHRAQTIQHLLNLLEDSEIAPHALDALAALKATEAIPAIKSCLSSSIPLVRTEASKALRRLQKKSRPGKKEGRHRETPATGAANVIQTSVNLEIEQVAELLRALISHVEGFGISEIESIETHLFDMQPEDESSWIFPTRYAGREGVMKIDIYMSDVDSPDIAISTCPELAVVIDQLVEQMFM